MAKLVRPPAPDEGGRSGAVLGGDPTPSTINLEAEPPSHDDIAAQFADVLGGTDEFANVADPTPIPEDQRRPRRVRAPDPEEEPPEDLNLVEESEDPSQEEGEPEQTEPETDDEFVRTLDELAGAFEVEPDELLTQLHVSSEDGTEVPLADVIGAWRAMPNAEAAAEERATLETQFEARRGQLQNTYDEKMIEAAELVSILQHQLVGQTPSEADLLRLQQESPEEAMSLQLNHMQRREALQNALGQIRQAAEARKGEREQTHQEMLQREHTKLLKAWPELVNPATAPNTDRAMRSYLGGIGISSDEINNIGDSRIFRVIRDAMQGSQLRKTGKLAIKTAQERRLRAPSPPPRARAEEPSQAALRSKGFKGKFARLQKSGHVDDAAAVLKELM